MTAPNLDFEDSDDEPMVEQSQSRQVFYSDVLPLLQAACGACHGEFRPPVYEGLGFFALDAGDEYLTMLSFGDVLIEGGGLLNKGQHDGPSWTAEQAAVINNWLQLDHDL